MQLNLADDEIRLMIDALCSMDTSSAAQLAVKLMRATNRRIEAAQLEFDDRLRTAKKTIVKEINVAEAEFLRLQEEQLRIELRRAQQEKNESWLRKPISHAASLQDHKHLTTTAVAVGAVEEALFGGIPETEPK